MKGEWIMKASCIAIDVSKGSSHIQSYIDSDTSFSEVHKIDHNRSGFNELLFLKTSLDKSTGQASVVVFEATGVYHRGLEGFLKDNGIQYFIVNPLQSAKFRKQELRTKKTDKRDCKNIAKVYFANDFRQAVPEDETYYTLRQLSREYENLLNHLRKAKVSFNEALEIVYPGYEKVFPELYTESSLEILKKFPHPKQLGRKSGHSVSTFLMRHNEHRELWCDKKAEELLRYTQECVSGCREEDVNVDIMIDQIKQVEYYIKLGDTTLQKMIGLAQQRPEFHLIQSIPGIGENLAARILAEIGDIRRFEGPKQLVAYAGIDPIIYQSGKNDGLHLHISKKGNKRLRCLLYLAVMCSLRVKTQETSIRKFYKKRRISRTRCVQKLRRLPVPINYLE